MTLIGVQALCGYYLSKKEWKSPKMANVNKNMRLYKNQKVPLFFFSNAYSLCAIKKKLYKKTLHERKMYLKKNKGYFLVFVTPPTFVNICNFWTF